MHTNQGASRTEFEDYWALQPEPDPALQPEVLYTRPYRNGVTTGPWQPILR